MNRDNKDLTDYDLDELDMNLESDDINLFKRENLIERLKAKFARDIESIDDQMKRDMEFWIKYRPSRWLSFIPKRFEKLILQIIEKKKSKQLVFYIALICCLIFVGFVPTLKFLFWYLFKIWLICILIPFAYWGASITAVYLRVIAIPVLEFFLSILAKLISR